jgi:alpha-tubulin suppressor-like RCC1 family protein
LARNLLGVWALNPLFMSLNRLPSSVLALSVVFCRFVLFLCAVWVGLASSNLQAAATRMLGDLNNDGEISVVDLTLLRRHVRGLEALAPADQLFADVNADGVTNEDDARALIRLITGEDSTRPLPPTGIRETSPTNGEESVSSSRRTGIILRFSMPVKDSPKFQDRTVFSASINGAALNSRAELSSDGRKLVLFVTDKIPGNTRVDVSLDTTGIKDLLDREIDGDGDGQPGGVFKFYYLTESLVVVPNTEIKGKVFASEKASDGSNVPLEGVIVRVAGTENAQVLTDSNGAFTLPCPAGRFFAEVDGRKVLGEDAFPNKAYYPFVVKAWEAVAGSKENLAVGTGEIFLPLIPAGALQTVSPTQETKVAASPAVVAANPDFAEISLTVPAGALRKEDGTSGGRIGMAPVPADRLPEPLAPGLAFPLVITIQTDGAGTFDQPVAVKFPNLPDQNGNTLKPGEKTGLWSFNHDTGSWELQGPMTVTDDGKYVTTDPGVGVRQPGWHGVLPGSQGVGPKRAVSAPELRGNVQKEIDKALQLAAQSSLPVRDAFMALGEMRGLADDLTQIAWLLQELQSTVVAYNESSSEPYWWSLYWIKQRIAKLQPSYDLLVPGGQSDLAAALARIQPQLDATRRYLTALTPFNQLAYSDDSYTWLSTQFADSNAALLAVLDSVQPYLDSLKAGAPLFGKTAFEEAVRVLFPGFNEPALSRAQEMDALAKFLRDMEPVSAVVASDHAERLRTVKLQMSHYLARAGALSIAANKPSKYGYLKIDAIGEPQRVRSNASGDYRMVLPPDREFSVTYVDPKTLQVGAYVGISGWNGTITDLYGPVLAPLQPNSSELVDLAYARDTDGDKLADTLETVIGTDLTKKDTDGDGASDHQEVNRGKNPLSGLAVGTGVIFTADTSQQGFESTDVDAGNELLFISERRSNGEPQGGLMVYSLESKTEPLRQGFLPLDSPVYRVRYGDTNLAVLSLHENGVAVVDVSSPTNPSVKYSYGVQPGESVHSAILVGDILVLGVNDLNTGLAKIVLRALESGEILREEPAGGSVSDLVANGTVVYALTKGNKSDNQWWYWAFTSAVYAGDVSRARESLPEGQSLFKPVTVREWEYSKSGGRLALAPGKLFYVYESGLTVLDLADPLRPLLVGDVFKPNSGFQRGWRHVLFDGSVDASRKMTFLAALGSSATDNPERDGDVAVFKFGQAGDFGDSANSWWQLWLNANTPMAEFVTQFDSRADNPRQVNLASGKVHSLAMAGGIVYAADTEQGLKVVNYRKYDSEGKAPQLAIQANSPSRPSAPVLRVQEGGLLALTALPADDVAVASVEWYVDGVRVAVTGGAPWGYTTRLPLLAGGPVRGLRIEARAYDTGGNMTSSERMVEVVEDPFPPAVLGVTPAALVRQLSSIKVDFNEPMDFLSLSGSLTLHTAGPDGKLGSADDEVVPGGLLTVSEAAVTLDFASSLPEGMYRAVLSGTVADTSGNILGDDYSWNFSVSTATTWLGGRGLWSDPAKWSSGTVPVPGDALVFPAGTEPNVVVGGRAVFQPPGERLVAGSSTFSRVLTKNVEGVVSVSGGAIGSTTPIYVGMLVTGSMVAEGTYVKSATVTEDRSDSSNQIQTTVFELSQPLVEGVPGVLPWRFATGGHLEALSVIGDTTLVEVDLAVSGTLSVSDRLAFGGVSSLGIGTLTTSGSSALLVAAAAVDTGSLLAGKTDSGVAQLKLTQPLVLSGSLAIESAGFRAADGKLTSSRVQLSSALDLAGHELRITGGYAGSVALQAPVGGGTFALTGPGRLAFHWKESLLNAGDADSDKLLLRVSAGKLVVPEDVTLDVSGLGQVSISATKLSNLGTVSIGKQGRLKVYNYELVGETAEELLGQDAVLDKLVSADEGMGEGTVVSVTGVTFALNQDGSLWAWGYNEGGILGVGSSEYSVTIPAQVGQDSDWKAVTTQGRSTFALKQDGSLWAWGYNYYGELGVGISERFVTVPTQVGTDADWKVVNIEGRSTFALKQDGSLWAWGNNYGGRLGVGSSERFVTVPMPVGTDTDWKFLTTWSGNNFALKQDGSLWAWGSNYWGELGVGSSEQFVTVPTQVGTDADWKSVDTNRWNTFALKQDGSLWAWGYNYWGVLGVGSSEQSVTAPTQVGTDADWKVVNTQGRSTFAMKQDGSLWAWGINVRGRLGLGSSEQYVTIPTRVGTDAEWKFSNAYFETNFALKQDGSLWAWGYNERGILGVGSVEQYVTVPTRVGSDADWSSVTISEGYNGFLAQKQDGSLWGWGENGDGQLGVGSMDPVVTVPTRVGVFADRLPPAVLPVATPSVRRQISQVSFAFGEPMDQATLTGSLKLRSAGPDGKLGTADDVAVPGGVFTGGTASVTLDFPAPLPEGLYRAVVSGSVKDLVGNALGADYTWDFAVSEDNVWLGGRGLWSDPSKWSYGMAPVPGDAVVFPAGTEPNIVVGGRATFGPPAESLVAGSSTFSRVLNKNADGVVVSVAGGGAGTSNTPIYVGMLVTGSMVAKGTYVKSATVTEDGSDPPNQIQTTVFELSQPLVEGITGVLPWRLATGGGLESVAVKGDTALVDVDLVVSGSLSVSDRLAFGGASSLGVGTLTTSGSAALLVAAAAVDTGSLVAGKTDSGAARLKLTQPLVLSGSLAVESTGFRAADGKLTSSWVQLNSGLDLAGHELRIFGGYAGSVALQAPLGGGSFALTGPGKLAFDWKENLLRTEGADPGKFLLRVSAGEVVVPENVTLDVAGLGQVSFSATKLSNYGTVRVGDQGWLKAYNYEPLGTAVNEVLGKDAVFETLDLPTGEGDESSWSFSHAIKQDGTLWAWGWNEAPNGVRGILGTGSTAQYVDEPQQVGTDTDWRAVFGSNSFYAIKTDGTLWAWGNNEYQPGMGVGNLGVGSADAVVAAPRQVGVDDQWRTVRAGWDMTVALKTDGSLWAWGRNSGWNGAVGILGTGSSAQYVNEPEQVGTDTNWDKIHGTLGNGCFVTKTDGSLWAWGQNDEGQLGVGYLSQVVATPTPVVPEAAWAGVEIGWNGGGRLVLGLRSDGTLWEWGTKTQGVPQQIGTDRDWKIVGFRGEPTLGQIPLAMKTDGTLWAWGYTAESTTPGEFATVSAPTKVASDVPWVGLPHFGPRSNVAVKADGTLWQSSLNWDAGGGLGVVFTRVGVENDWVGLAGTKIPVPQNCRIFKANGSLWRFELHPDGLESEWIPDPAPVEVVTGVPWRR